MSTRVVSKPTRKYYLRVAQWYENRFLSCGEKARPDLLKRANEYYKKAESLPFHAEDETPEVEVVSCLPARCNSCDTPIYVPIHDYSETANYCYPCAWSRLEGEADGGSHV